MTNIHQQDNVFELVKCNEAAQAFPLQVSVNDCPLKFILNPPLVNRHKSFFQNVEDLINNYTRVKKGKLPDSFYLIENDYLIAEEPKPEQLRQLEQVCRWIVFLEQALPHTEEKNDSYLFVLLTEDKKSKGFKKHLIESRFTVDDLRDLPGLERFEEMLNNEDLHCSERLAVVRNALEELLSKNSSTKQKLGYVLSEFDGFKQLYQDNYETYINGFSLKSFKKEVIEKHEEFASKIEGTLNDVINKGLVIPLSIATIGTIIKDNELANSLVVCFAVLLLSVFMWRLVQQHLSRLSDIKLALNEVFERFKEKEENAAQFVNDKRIRLTERSNSISRDLKALGWLSWMPFISAIALLFFKHPDIVDFFINVVGRLP